MIAYVTTQGAKITREGQRLIVVSPGMQHTLFMAKLQQLFIFGNVHLTAQARTLILREHIDTVFLQTDGRYLGRLATPESANVFLRKRQFLLTDDEKFCLKVARRIVQAKILNQATLLLRVKRSRQQTQAGEAAKELRQLALAAEQAVTLDSLRGFEGNAAALYFRHLPLAFKSNWGFTRRVRRPPTDPVNAVLSLLYTILINRCYAAVRLAGLDPQPGVLHSLAYGRNALPLDMVEEFRAMLADSLTIALFNLEVLDHDDFQNPPSPDQEEGAQEEDTQEQDLIDKATNCPLGQMSTEISLENTSDLVGEQMDIEPVSIKPDKKALLLKPESLKKVISAFAKKLETTFFHPVAKRHLTYNESLLFQARQYRQVIDGELENYGPLMLR